MGQMSDALSQECSRLAKVCEELFRRHACRDEPANATVLWQCRVQQGHDVLAVPVLQKAFAALACCAMSWGVGVKDGRPLVTLRAGALLGVPRRKLGLLPTFV